MNKMKSNSLLSWVQWIDHEKLEGTYSSFFEDLFCGFAEKRRRRKVRKEEVFFLPLT